MSITSCYSFYMKTAISIPDELFKEVEKYAREHHYSRSKVFVTAVKEFLNGLKSRQMLILLDEVCGEVETSEDIALRKKALKHYKKKVLKETY